MEKLISCFLAIIFCIICTSCSQDTTLSDTSSDTFITLLSLKSADIEMADDFEQILCTEKRAGYFLIFGKLKTGEYSGYITDNQFAEKKIFSFEPQENEIVKTAALMRFGKAAVMTILDDEAFIYVFDKDGNQENCYNIGDVVSADDYFTELIYADDGFYINVFCNNVVYIDNDGKYKGNVSTDGQSICRIINDSDGNPCMLLSEDMKMTLCRMNNGEVTEKVALGEFSDYVNAVGVGIDDYRIVIVVSDGLYGLKEDKWVKITDFSDNDFNISALKDIEMTAENEFTALVSKDGIKYELRLLSQRDISEIKQKNIIKLANVSVSEYDPYNDLIKKYNSESDSNKIEIVQYRSELYEDAMRSLDLDIISGNAPDIIVFNSYVPIEKFGNRESIFVDMYALMDKDNDIKRTDFLDGFLESLETNGKLLQITQSFCVESYMIKDKFSNGLKSWNLEELESIYKKYSDNMNFSLSSQYNEMQYMLDELIVYSRFYDKNTAECSFNSSEFIDAMKFIKNNKIGISANDTSYTESYGGEDAEITAFRNDNVLLQRASIPGFFYLRNYQQVYSNEDVTFIGFPSDDKINAVSMPFGTYGIMASSQNIDGAWDFLKYYLFSEDSRNYFENSSFFSGLEKYYKEQLDYFCTPHTYIDSETDEEKNADIYTYFPEDSHEPITIELQPFTNEEAEKYDTFVRTALKNSVNLDDNIRNIVSEETSAYFDGERSAEDTADIIQNRVNIYLSEHS